MSADSPDDAWAVGNRGVATLVEHWDGTAWTEVPTESRPGATLSSVVALSPTDVWVVGACKCASRSRTLTEHWDGVAFTVVPSPNPGNEGHQLLDVSAVSSKDVWAVGQSFDNPLVLHWDGTVWSMVSTMGLTFRLSGVSALARNDVWVGGNELARWNGRQWQVLWQNHDTGDVGYIHRLHALSSTEAWAVGYDNSRDDYAAHWEDDSWGDITGSCSYSELDDIAPVGPDDTWAVGNCLNQETGHARAAIVHWNGTSWRLIHNPVSGSLSGLAATSSTDIWAVGHTWRGHILIQHWDGSAWSVVPAGL